MALDRQSIARRDFPAARRGYEQGAVDRHLAAVADEVEELRRRAATPGAALATQTSEQVRAIIEAAESSAASIRDAATADARRHVAHVAEAADALRERIDALERELTGTLGSLRGGADRLRSELDAVLQGTARLAEAGGVPADVEIAPTALGATLREIAAAQPVEEEIGEEPPGAVVEDSPAKPAERSTDVVGARIVALEWATQGRTREEVARHLVEHYELDDPAGLIDAVYARLARS